MNTIFHMYCKIRHLIKFQNNATIFLTHDIMSRNMRFPTLWYVQPAKARTSLRIRAVWSEPLLVAWIMYDSKATDRTAFGVSKLSMKLHRLVLVYSCQNDTLLEITCRGSYGSCGLLDFIFHCTHCHFVNSGVLINIHTGRYSQTFC